jgi:hypothetical protein
MLTVIRRPQGHSIGTTAVVATVAEAYGAGDVSFIKVSHGLSDGDFIYVTSNIGDYNGFWYVDVITGDNFKLKASENSDFLQWVANGTITYYESDLTHGWSCVHLPIVYQLESNLWPVNSSDTARTVSSFTDANGYVNLNLSGALKGTVNDLDYVKISGASDDDLNGVFQITDAVSTSDVTINLAYDSGYSFAGATVQYYYNNYHVRVKVFGGLAEDHAWEFQKPFVELAELKLTPDSNNQIIFSVHEILKSQINTRNNLLLNTLPLNLDFFTSFYISYAESYDTSDGSEVSTFVSSYTSDLSDFMGYASNSKLDFKNIHSGFLTDYIMNKSTAKFLTLFSIPVLFTCGEDSSSCYQDISVLINKNTVGEFIQNPGFDGSILPWQNQGSGQTWSYVSGSVRVNLTSSNTLSKQLVQTFSIKPPGNYIFSMESQIVSWATSPGNQQTDVSVDAYNNGVFVGTIMSFQLNSIIAVTNQQSSDVPDSFDSIVITFENVGTDTDYMAAIYSLNGEGNFSFSLRTRLYNNGDIQSETTEPIEDSGNGIYRLPIEHPGCEYDLVKLTIMSGSLQMSEEKTFIVDCNCDHQNIYLTWLNNLGGFDYWNFTAKKDYQVEIQESGVTRQNIFPTWPHSYGTFADTIRKQTYRVSNKFITVRSQHVTQAQLDAISYIKSSVLVQIVTSRQDRRTVIVDADSFMKYRDRDDTYSIAFNIYFTDDIPSQTV